MFGENLKAMRKAKGYTQEELAIKINVVRQTVSKWEKGQTLPNAAQFLALCRIYGVRDVLSVFLGEPGPLSGLNGEGRILVRPSGTEALMRVMVEAKTHDLANETAGRLADLIAGL